MLHNSCCKICIKTIKAADAIHPAAFSHKALLFTSQSVSKTGISMLTVVVGIP